VILPSHLRALHHVRAHSVTQAALAHRLAVLVPLHLAVAHSLHLPAQAVIQPSRPHVRVQVLHSHRAVHLHSLALAHRCHSQAVALVHPVIRHLAHPVLAHPVSQVAVVLHSVQALSQAVHPQVFRRVLVARHFHQAQAVHLQAALLAHAVLRSRRVRVHLAPVPVAVFHHQVALSQAAHLAPVPSLPAALRSLQVAVLQVLAPAAVSHRRVRLSQVVVLHPVSLAQAPSHRRRAVFHLRAVLLVLPLHAPVASHLHPALFQARRRRLSPVLQAHSRPQALKARSQVARRLSALRPQALSALAVPLSLRVLKVSAAHPLRSVQAHPVSLDNGYSISITILPAGLVSPTAHGMRHLIAGKLQGQECRWWIKAHGP